MLAKITKHMSEKLTKMVPKWSQNLSKIDPGGGLEATWEPPLKQGASKTSFLMILAPFWDPLWDQFGLILGIIFLMFFWSGFLMALASIWAPKTPPKWDPKGCQRHILSKSENRALAAARARSRGVWGCWKSSFFRCFFGTPFWDGFWSPFWWFWLTFGVPFGDHFGHFWGTVFASIFRGFPGLARISSQAWVEGDLRGIWGPVTGLHQQDKQIYRWKSADL